MLEKVVECRELADVGVFVAGRRESLLEERHVDLGGNLEIVLSVEGEDGAGGFLEIGQRIVVEEETEPRRREHAKLLFEGGRRNGGIHATGFDEVQEFLVELVEVFFLANEIVGSFVEVEAGLDLGMPRLS